MDSRGLYRELAASGLRMPIATDLILHEQPDPGRVVNDGERLGRVMVGTAQRYQTPLAFSLMDLRLEKRELLRLCGYGETDVDGFHLREAPEEGMIEQLRGARGERFGERNQAHLDAIRYVAAKTELVPVGMAIGPFSLMTKLIADPITAVALAGAGVRANEDPAVLMVERALALAEETVGRSIAAQIAAGARAMMICEPAANRVYLSPKQIATGSRIFERFVMQPALRLRAQLVDFGVDLIFHDCGELTDAMVEEFAVRLRPTVLSLGSSRRLWEDAQRVPDDVVLFGNLPTKNFYSDAVMPVERVAEMTRELVGRMRETGYAHIVGSECDVLFVAEAAETIRRKVDVIMTA